MPKGICNDLVLGVGIGRKKMEKKSPSKVGRKNCGLNIRSEWRGNRRVKMKNRV